MLRLVSLLAVVAILAVLWLTVFDSTMGGDCDPSASTVPASMTERLPDGVAKMVNDC